MPWRTRTRTTTARRASGCSSTAATTLAENRGCHVAPRDVVAGSAAHAAPVWLCSIRKSSTRHRRHRPPSLPAPLHPPPLPPCTALVDGVCWRLGAPAETCAELCGTGSAVDADATVLGSATEAVQAALAPHAIPTADASCGLAVELWQVPKFPYAGVTLLDTTSDAWTCAVCEGNAAEE